MMNSNVDMSDGVQNNKQTRKKSVSQKRNKALHRLTTLVLRNEAEFRAHFRMSRQSFEELIRRYHGDWTTINGRAAIKIETGFSLLLWALVHKESFKTISERFDLAKGHAHNVFLKACRILYEDKASYIKWPDDSELKEVTSEFDSIQDNAFPGVIGCLGVTHIRISGHRIDDTYCNFYGYKSVMVQAVCDAHRSFTNVYVGWPGSSLNALMWQHNPLNELLKEKNLSQYHLVADSSFPVDTFLMCPYTDSRALSDAKNRFNKKLHEVRSEIDETFLSLKLCFKRILDLDLNKIEYAKYIIMSAFVLYNFILSQNEPIKCEVVGEDMSENEKFEDFQLIEGNPKGVLKRDYLASILLDDS